MSRIYKYKWIDPINTLNDTLRYLDDKFTIDNPEFEKHISSRTQDDSSIHENVYDKHDDFGFLIVNFQLLKDSHRTFFTFRSWFDLLCVAVACRISILTTCTALQIIKSSKITFGKFFQSCSELCLNFLLYCFKNMFR